MRRNQVKVDPRGPERPSHYGQDNNEFIPRDQTDNDYPGPTEQSEPTNLGAPVIERPTAVFLVEPPPRARTLKTWQPSTVTIDNLAASVNAGRQQIASNDRRRTRFIVANLEAANSVFITADAMNNNQAFAYELPAGKREEFFHNGPMWAFCAATKSAKIALFAELEVDQS
jgi:hypothetical protein